MTIYQHELLRQLPKLNCTGKIDDESGTLHISANDIPLCSAGKKNKLYWNQDTVSDRSSWIGKPPMRKATSCKCQTAPNTGQTSTPPPTDTVDIAAIRLESLSSTLTFSH